MNMADDVAKVKQARKFAIAQLITGFSLLCFGIGEHVRKLTFRHVSFGKYMIMAGIVVFITGCLGILGTRRERSILRDAFAALFPCFSLISALLGGGLVGLYSIRIFQFAIWDHHLAYRHQDYGGFTADITILVAIFILGILECCAGFGVLVATSCHSSPPSQASSGVPVAVRMQADRPFVADQTVFQETQDNEPQIVLLPDSREMDDPPPPYEAVASGHHVLQVDMPQSHEKAEHGQWKTYV